ncbi:protease inhibitor I42 family protein [Microbacterium sulfonylureivorans]|uniref:protease inhibitor I42 family protein n=1 Tax=Microbacterium sulfonylureivorans TaxID=2486854 RepID=UPI000FDC8700|nr:protease inhibitor I42 family protein [Microbacterium sulfonylureivorans]
MEHVTALAGEPFRIVLESFGAAGYEWRLRDDQPGLRLEARESLPPEAGSPPGAPHWVVFTLVAETAGAHEVVFVLQRPWEAEPVDERAFTIDATD